MEQQVIDVARDALTTILIVASPMLLVAIIVGLAVSIFQATTQIQEQTLAFVPKIVAVFLCVLIFGNWMLSVLSEFFIRIYDDILKFINM